MTGEFELIARYFTRPTPGACLGVGDDAAIVRISSGCELAVTTDTLVSGTHFFPDAEPRSVGHKALAVNLSDLAAMGARPRWALLALTVPDANDDWLAAFSEGFFGLAVQSGTELIGGDTTRGPLSVTVTVLGELPAGKALRRDGAVAGDEVWVSGELGSAALALRHLQGEVRLKGAGLAHCMARLNEPTPRIVLGQRLLGIANSAIDVSDGLIADMGHVAERSGVRAELTYADVPRSAEVMPLRNHPPVRAAILTGGDDYELLFTASPSQANRVGAIAGELGLALTRIGRITAGSGVLVRDEGGHAIDLQEAGYEHFR